MPLDFTSSLYLGLGHATVSLRPWVQFTTGKPAALEEPPVVRQVLGGLVSLIGCEAGVVGASTLHLGWDMAGLLSRPRITVYLDDGTYPILRWSIERASCRGVPIRRFPSHDVEALRHLLQRDHGPKSIPLVLADGSCPACGRVTPLPEYLDAVRQSGGMVLIDDTQALGILGAQSARAPYGVGGGGSLRWHSLTDPRLMVIASLAKGFGVPMAVLAGGSEMVKRFARNSESRIHCSPPSVAALHAALAALEINRIEGDARRSVLAKRVLRFRRHLARLGLSRGRNLFPMQILETPTGNAAVDLHRRLARSGIRSALIGSRGPSDAKLAFIVTAVHSEADIDSAASALEYELHHGPISSHGRRYVCQHDRCSADPLDSGRADGKPESAAHWTRLSAAAR